MEPVKIPRRDSNNCHRMTIHQHGLTDHTWIATEASPPIRIAQQDYRIGASCFFFCWQYQAPHLRLNAEHRKEVPGDVVYEQGAGCAVCGKPYLAKLIGQHVRKRVGLLAIIEKVRVGEARTIGAACLLSGKDLELSRAL